MRNLKKTILSLLAIFFATYIYGQTPVALKIGDPAPELKVTWIKGTPIQSFDKDKLYVVEFWATWCGPCRAIMPHLSELAKVYADKVIFIGVNIWEKGSDKKLYETFLPSIKEFVKSQGNKMDYNVVMDNNDQHMGNNWMKAAGQYGIPATFLIKQEKIIWIGHPSKLDTTLMEVIGGTYNVENFAKEYNQSRAQEQDELAPLLALNKQVTDLIAAKNYSEALNAIDNALVMTKSPYDISVRMMKFTTLLEYDVPAALAYSKELCEEIPSGKGMIGQAIASKEGLPKEAYQLALGYFNEFLAKPGIPTSIVHDYMAKCYFNMNDLPNAIASEEKAIELGNKAIAAGEFQGMINDGTIKEYQESLAKYKAER